MSGDIIPFRGKQEPSSSILSTPVIINSKKVDAIMMLRGSSLVDVNRFEKENDINAKHFFDTLQKTQTLFITQTHGKKIVPEDTLYVLTDPDDDMLREGNNQYTIGVGAFLRYIDKKKTSPMDAIMEFTRKHNIRIEYREDDKEIYAIVQDMPDVQSFFPENIAIASQDETRGYEYNIRDGRGELWISAMNFDLSTEEVPSLLFLMIETMHVLKLGPSDTDILQIIRYWNNEKIPSLAINATYNQFINEIDQGIARAYPLIYNAHQTPEERRTYLYDKIIKLKLDPQLIGGNPGAIENDEAE